MSNATRRRVERLEADARIERGEDCRVVLLQSRDSNGTVNPSDAEIQGMITEAVASGRAANADDVMVIQLVGVSPGTQMDRSSTP